MRLFRFVPLTAIVVALGAAATVHAAGQQMPPTPKPGPEHEILKADAGTWDAVIELVPAPGVPPMTFKGVEVNTLGCGGLCLVSEFKGDLMGQPFEGRGLFVWDPAKKRYVGSWTDSMSLGLATMEGTWDPAAKTLTGWMEGPDPSGQRVKQKTVTESRGNTRVMKAFATGPDGKEMQTMSITYTRRK
ncbi:MAG: DUF1579 domain-containing protein [Vicinamibacterales bacterium]